jgi:iron complex transport system permease protein
VTSLAHADAVSLVRAGRRRRSRRWVLVTSVLAVLALAAYAISLMVGQTFYTPAEVWGVITGHQVPGASFTVGELRLPRATTAILTGICFGMGGVVFQTMLRNPLASPDVIGISSGASAAAVIGIVVLSLDETPVSFLATGAALVAALLIYLLAYKKGGSGARLILIGIGVAAITGNLNDATWNRTIPLAVIMVVVVPLLLIRSRDLETLRLGDETAAALGLPVERRRIVLIVLAVCLLAFATAAAGPISFVAFLAGPIAVRILGPVGSPVLPAGLVGGLLVLVADLAAQYAFGTRLPVGVVTGVLGAPYLVYLLIRGSRSGGSTI